MADTIWGFFYGGLISPGVVARGFSPKRKATASLTEYALTISPPVNLRPEPQAIVFGRQFETTHAGLDRVYGPLAAKYLSYPVLARQEGGRRPQPVGSIRTDRPQR
ncbi:hypothetical protein [Sphingomonas alpina]|uniref:Gamma-glutamylcyclotransferase n=1 Tax=Sphingomonas alpina TaxID=653931 RepID=A0A7H0LDG8_9SPHN|nr:hypothetical protein [Sphingomonas alpina]QNQ07721.1 hypothetical protein H3Z74_12935 [Sphingomonas alpina]